MGYVFISYSRKDVAYAAKLVNALRREGFNPWWDLDNLSAGTHWQNRLHQQILSCDAYILIMSRHARVSKWVPDELVIAKTKGKKIFPILLDDTQLFLGIQAVQSEDVRGGKLPSKKFYDQLASVTTRRKKANLNAGNFPVDPDWKMKVKSGAESIVVLLTQAGYVVADFFAIFFKVISSLASALSKTSFMKKINTKLQKDFERRYYNLFH